VFADTIGLFPSVVISLLALPAYLLSAFEAMGQLRDGAKKERKAKDRVAFHQKLVLIKLKSQCSIFGVEMTISFLSILNSNIIYCLQSNNIMH
jgi:hypothetical protein